MSAQLPAKLFPLIHKQLKESKVRVLRFSDKMLNSVVVCGQVADPVKRVTDALTKGFIAMDQVILKQVCFVLMLRRARVVRSED